jgi:hypothetical protein
MAFVPSSLASHPSVAIRERQGATAGHPATDSCGNRVRLLDVVEQTIVPELAEHHRQEQRLEHDRAIETAAIELARLAASSDCARAADRIGQLCPGIGSDVSEGAELIERAARALGDLWEVDQCSEFEVTVGFCGLQLALRRLGLAWRASRAQAGPVPSVLVAPSPGEPHMLRATLDSELLWMAGWNPGYEFPATDDALQRLVANTWFDALDVSLSLAFRREHWVPRLAETIARARRASRNPRLLVFVGGRLFLDCPDAWRQVAADGWCPTAAMLAQEIRHRWHPSNRAPDQPARLPGNGVSTRAE